MPCYTAVFSVFVRSPTTVEHPPDILSIHVPAHLAGPEFSPLTLSDLHALATCRCSLPVLESHTGCGHKTAVTSANKI